jgi:hypothetical protein
MEEGRRKKEERRRKKKEGRKKKGEGRRKKKEGRRKKKKEEGRVDSGINLRNTAKRISYFERLGALTFGKLAKLRLTQSIPTSLLSLTF